MTNFPPALWEKGAAAAAAADDDDSHLARTWKLKEMMDG
jgi:hypothetical protein